MSTDDDRLEALTSTLNESQAAMIVSVLQDSGIEAFAEGGLLANFRAETFSEVKVMVWEKDVGTARAVLADYKEVMSEIDWDRVDVGEKE